MDIQTHEQENAEMSDLPVDQRLLALLEATAGALVVQSEDFSVDIEELDGQLHAYLRCNPDDIGRLIGRRGRSIKALRSLCWALGQRFGFDVEVEIVEQAACG